MIKLLTNMIRRRCGDTSGQAARYAYGKLAGLIGIIFNLLLFGAKLLIGLFSGAVSIVADAINNLSDASGSIITLLGFRLAEKPADEKHPYGHARIEYLTGLAVAAMILLIGAELAKNAFHKILHPQVIQLSPALFLVLALSIAVKLWMALFYYRIGKQIDSAPLLANAADSRNDAISTSAVLVGCLIHHWFDWNIDGYIGLAVAAFILWSGIGIAKDTIQPLLGESAAPELKQMVQDEILKHEQVLGVHDLLVHDYGPGQKFATVHVEMDVRVDPLVCHDIIDNIERSFWTEHRIHLTIHYDPVVTDDEEINTIRQQITAILAAIDPAISIHDFRMVTGPQHTNLIFDMVLPDSLQSRQDQVKQQLDAQLNAGPRRYYTVITFDFCCFN